MRSLGLDFERIDAFDWLETDTSWNTSLARREIGSCWKSHARAFDALIESGDDHALILEDDAVLQPNFDWGTFLAALPGQMETANVDYLQLGFITWQYKRRLVPRWLDRALQVRRNESWSFTLGEVSFPAIIGSSRAGAHAYVISRRLATVVREFNDPPWLGPDGFFDYLSSAQRVLGHWRLARLATSLVEQETRSPTGTRGAPELDSDVH